MENNRQEFKKRLKGLLGFILSLSIVVSMSGMNAYALRYDGYSDHLSDLYYVENGEQIGMSGGSGIDSIVVQDTTGCYTAYPAVSDGYFGRMENIPSDKVRKMEFVSFSERILTVRVGDEADYPYIINYHDVDGSGPNTVSVGSLETTMYFKDAEDLGFTREGKQFKGWAESQNGTVVEFSSHEFITEGTYDLYAVWGDYPYYINFYCANGTKTIYSMDSRIVMLSKDDPVANKPGYNFKWWSNTDGGAREFGDGDAYTFSSSGYLNLYAVYEKKSTTIDTPGTYHLVPGKQYLMIGSYKVNGSSVSYAGGAFYVPVEGDYTFQ